MSDGTYTYQYDNEGNRTARFIDANSDGVLDSGDTSITIYVWDYRNRLAESATTPPTPLITPTRPPRSLTTPTMSSTAGSAKTSTPTATAQSIIRRASFTMATGSSSNSTKPAPAAFRPATFSHRYLWGPVVDQILADEQVTSLQSPGNVIWPLTDDLGTVRDLATYNAQTGTASIVDHVIYDGYGKVASDTSPSNGCLFKFTARPTDPATGLQNNGRRWYDPVIASWASEDPLPLPRGRRKSARYCGDSPVLRVQPKRAELRLCRRAVHSSRPRGKEPFCR